MIAKLVFFLLAALSGPISLVAPDLAAAPPSRTFLLRVCNKAEMQYGTLNLAIASLTPDKQFVELFLDECRQKILNGNCLAA